MSDKSKWKKLPAAAKLAQLRGCVKNAKATLFKIEDSDYPKSEWVLAAARSTLERAQQNLAREVERQSKPPKS